MSDKKSKKLPKPPAKHSLFGFRAKLNAAFEDEKTPGLSQVVPNETQGEPAESIIEESSIPTVVGHSAEQGIPPEEENPGRAGRDDGGSVAVSVLEQDDKITAPGAPAIPIDATRAGESTDGFGPLKALLRSISAICAGHGDTVAVGGKVEGLESHLMQLDKLFSTPPTGDVAELRRRDALICKIGDVEGRLRALNDKLEQQRTAGQITDDENVLALSRCKVAWVKLLLGSLVFAHK